MADYSPVYSGGVEPFTSTTSAAVTGGAVLVASGEGTVAESGGASTLVVGVAAHDAASGARVTIWPLDGCVHELLASGAIAALAGIQSDADGEVATVTTSIPSGAAAATLIGTALSAAAGTPLKVRVQGRR